MRPTRPRRPRPQRFTQPSRNETSEADSCHDPIPDFGHATVAYPRPCSHTAFYAAAARPDESNRYRIYQGTHYPERIDGISCN
ncbi:hypothetical protein SGPA1_30669 [Streptomyces misionensis JCM 4497]